MGKCYRPYSYRLVEQKVGDSEIAIEEKTPVAGGWFVSGLNSRNTGPFVSSCAVPQVFDARALTKLTYTRGG